MFCERIVICGLNQTTKLLPPGYFEYIRSFLIKFEKQHVITGVTGNLARSNMLRDEDTTR